MGVVVGTEPSFYTLRVTFFLFSGVEYSSRFLSLSPPGSAVFSLFFPFRSFPCQGFRPFLPLFWRVNLDGQQVTPFPFLFPFFARHPTRITTTLPQQKYSPESFSFSLPRKAILSFMVSFSPTLFLVGRTGLASLSPVLETCPSALSRFPRR